MISQALLLVFPALLFADSSSSSSSDEAIAANKYPNQAIADFTYGDNVMSGNLMVDMGVIKYDITFDDIKTLDGLLPGGYDECTQGGMYYHIHVGSCAKDAVQFGTDCNSCLGHYDPFGVCGDASNHTLCKENKGCLPEPQTVCNEANFDADPYRACQVGDWSGKYGLAQVNNGLMVGGGRSFYEVVPGDILSKEMSVVFHCNNKDRAFCRSFADSGKAMKYKTVPSQVNSKESVPNMIQTDFSDTLGFIPGTNIPSSLSLLSNGSANYVLVGAILNKKLQRVFGNFSCLQDGGNFDVSIWTTTTNAFSTKKSLSGSQCNDVLRAQWDINVQCESIFSDQYDEGLCSKDKMGEVAVCGNGAAGIYDCNWLPDTTPIYPRYTCAPGDLSNKFGQYNIQNGLLRSFDDSTSLIPYLTDLIPSSSSNIATAVAVHCPIKDTASRSIQDVEFLVCAEWYIPS